MKPQENREREIKNQGAERKTSGFEEHPKSCVQLLGCTSFFNTFELF